MGEGVETRTWGRDVVCSSGKAVAAAGGMGGPTFTSGG